MMTAAQRLRQKLLDLAIRGKLVPQNPKDEPAEKLLARIRRERNSDSSEATLTLRHLKKTRNVSEASDKSEFKISDDEKPFALPPTWTWCWLGDVMATIATGPFGSMLHKSDYVPNGIPLVNPMHIVEGRIAPSDKMRVSEETAIRLSEYRLAAGMVVLGRRGEMGRCAPVTDNENGWLCGTGSFFLDPLPCLDQSFLVLVLSSQYAKAMFEGDSIGTTMFNLNHGILQKLPIPLPPLAEQKRIVAALEGMLKAADAVATGMEKIAALKDKARAKILDLAIRGKLVKQDAADEPAEKLLSRIRSGGFQAGLTRFTGLRDDDRVEVEKCRKHRASGSGAEPQLYTSTPLHGKTKNPVNLVNPLKKISPITDDEKPFDIPQGWAWCRLGEISDVQLGKMLDAKKNVGKECRYLANISVRWGDFDLKDLRTTFFTDDEVEKFSLRENDLLVCEGGVPGRCAVWRERDTDIKYQKAIHRVRPYAINADYLQHYFEAIHDRPFFTSHFTGSTIHHLPREVLLTLPIPLPPLAEQQRIVAKVDEMLAACDALTSNSKT